MDINDEAPDGEDVVALLNLILNRVSHLPVLLLCGIVRVGCGANRL